MAKAMRSAAAYLRRARRRLESLDFDGDAANLLVVAPLRSRLRPRYRRAVLELDWSLEQEETAEGLALKGKAFSFLGEYENAKAALDRAVELDPSARRARRWRAEAALLRGDAAAARADLDVLARDAAGEPWTLFYSGACALAEADTARALRELDAAAAADASVAAPRVLRGLALARSGNVKEALARLDEAAALKGDWTLAFRGMVKAEAGDRAGAQADLAAALAAEPMPWLYVLRSRFWEQAGYVAEAVADMAAAVRLEPGVPTHLARRAHLFFCRRRHAQALRDITRAIRLAPRDGSLRSQRAEVYYLIGSLERAQRDLEAARRLSPPDPALDHRLAHVRVLRGRTAAAQALYPRAVGSDAAAQRAYWAGYGALRRKQWARAAVFFARALSAARKAGSPEAQKMRFYGTLARALAAPAQGRRRKADARPGELRLCSLGLFAPYTATVEVARALSGCDVAFNNLAGGETAEFLWSLAGAVRPATYDGMDDEDPWADRIFAALRAKRTVAFATRGHAQVFGGLAHELVRRCGSRVPWRSYGALSSLDVLTAQARGWPAEPARLQAYDCTAIESGAYIAPGWPSLIYFYGGADHGRLGRLRERLALAFPQEHPVRLYGPKYDDAPVTVPLKSLGDAVAELHPSIVLYVPEIAEIRG